MYLICNDATLQQDILQKLGFSNDDMSNKVFSLFTILPTIDDVAVAVKDLSESNLHSTIRYLIANAEKALKLAVLKRCWTVADEDCLDEIVRREFEQAHEGNQSALERSTQLPDGAWKNDRVQQLKRWQTIPSINYNMFTVDDSLKTSLSSFMDVSARSSVDDQTSKISVSAKPPVLHWTLTPLDAEIQLIIRISFPLAGPDQSTFMNIRKSLHGYFDSAYEWTHGVLLTRDLVRLHVERLKATVIELAARICVDELEEEQAAAPMKLLWPYLAVVLRNTLDHLNKHEYLQYTLELIPYGTCFFEPPLQARVFDLTVFMATANEYGKVGFRYQNQVHEVNLQKLLPDGTFASLSQLLAVEPPRPQRPQSDVLNESVNRINSDDSTTKTTYLSASPNKGRRVSFGTIKLINEVNPAPVNGVDEYVDTMLKQTMENLMSS
ncbi:hypothetical protein KIN20_027574 [Parelaphostrongylus tenuis]|uniref:Uncharacterized protein n=1 Tax=Parelaphostrongylus tenuis TaxID=148309 RepID=A0AAD5QZJ8_PARTN|nr:hypothetical protein KIN20_027574 [Parelaphostrongylus tenuis]